MMSTDTTPTRRNTRFLRVLKALDLLVGAVAIAGGVLVFITPPPSFIAVVQIPWLIVAWGAVLVLGGAASFVGRVSGIWLLESTGVLGIATGIAIYVIVLLGNDLSDGMLNLGTSIGIMVIAAATLVHRYIELQIYTSEPSGETFVQRLLSIFRIRTAR